MKVVKVNGDKIMIKKTLINMLVIVLSVQGITHSGENKSTQEIMKLSNSAYQLTVTHDGEELHVRLYDVAADFVWSDAPYYYRAVRSMDLAAQEYQSLESLSINQKDDTITINGRLAGLELEHVFELPLDKPIMEERIRLLNTSDSIIKLKDLEMGLQQLVIGEKKRVLKGLREDRLVAVPFRHRATDPPGHYNDFSVKDLVFSAKDQSWRDENFMFMQIPPWQYISEGWAWTHGKHTLGIFKFCQENMQFSILSTNPSPDGVYLRLGGACMLSGEPAALARIAPGQSVDLGIVRYQTVEGDYKQAMYAFRDMLNQKGCCFPKDYDPPVHWEELFDNPEWSGLSSPGKPKTSPSSMRAYTYTKALLKKEAAKARDYSCQALYLDPGWDTKFGTLIWGTEWLGPRREFIEEMESKYGLKVSLHCALASWMTMKDRPGGPIDNWPKESFRMDAEGNIVESSVCLGSKQYLDVAAKRLLECCADGVVFFMFDGNWWQGGCWNPDHGHPVPYYMEDHIRANVALAQRIHVKYPKVLIEMQDMIAGGRRNRVTPVYYKYGLPGSYDENWGFELMWDPYRDLVQEGRALALYYYNLSCNIPLYLHIDLRADNKHCLVLWWYASTCRHLGIGGTHTNMVIAEAQKAAMRKYRSLERFYKRGLFYGINEEIHLHVLPEENAFVVNMFNLSDERRMVKGTIRAEQLGIDPDRWYMRDGRCGIFSAKAGTLVVRCALPPWSAEISVFRAL